MNNSMKVVKTKVENTHNWEDKLLPNQIYLSENIKKEITQLTMIVNHNYITATINGTKKDPFMIIR